MSDPRQVIHPDLERKARSGAGDELLDVIVELHQDPAAEPSAAQMRESFSQTKKPVEDVISELGGTVTGDAWINYTLRAKVPAGGLAKLSGRAEVRALDVPHR